VLASLGVALPWLHAPSAVGRLGRVQRAHTSLLSEATVVIPLSSTSNCRNYPNHSTPPSPVNTLGVRPPFLAVLFCSARR
jgi:hypothetical protein